MNGHILTGVLWALMQTVWMLIYGAWADRLAGNDFTKMLRTKWPWFLPAYIHTRFWGAGLFTAAAWFAFGTPYAWLGLPWLVWHWFGWQVRLGNKTYGGIDTHDLPNALAMVLRHSVMFGMVPVVFLAHGPTLIVFVAIFAWALYAAALTTMNTGANNADIELDRGAGLGFLLGATLAYGKLFHLA